MKPVNEVHVEDPPHNAGHWPAMAKYWPEVGPPLRPVVEDIGFCAEAIQDWVPQHGAPRVLLLGVTPELYRLSWPEGTDFLAVDRTQAMIDMVWPGPKDAVQCSDWTELGLPDGSRDIALCDGGLHLLAHPRDQQRLACLLKRVISDQGLLILRLFVSPPRRESVEAVLADLMERRVSSLNILKLRLGMALMENANEGVELDAVWRALYEVAPDLDALARRLDWPIKHLRAIEAYRGSKARYHFVSLDQVRDLFCGDDDSFKVLRVCVPAYELGERCPTVILSRCGGRGRK